MKDMTYIVGMMNGWSSTSYLRMLKLPKYGRANLGEGSLVLLLLVVMYARKREMIQNTAIAPARGPSVDFFLMIQARSGAIALSRKSIVSFCSWWYDGE